MTSYHPLRSGDAEQRGALLHMVAILLIGPGVGPGMCGLWGGRSRTTSPPPAGTQTVMCSRGAMWPRQRRVSTGATATSPHVTVSGASWTRVGVLGCLRGVHFWRHQTEPDCSALSVPGYLGCFVDSGAPPALSGPSGTSTKLTVQVCLRFCRMKGYQVLLTG